ncbi:hypothetical protein FPRO05_13716 [Fusarium proliferatum]|uniref:Uncharacterized protein n=1 Tax=Gibberella intermedia TaxID=948311 RepID=A0A365MXK7_GIBIN|nr:hypothetical protein FPRO05_13716 [Fusarium proliferatum]
MFTQATLLVVKKAEDGTNWLAELCSKLTVLERDEDAVPLFVLISSRTSLPSFRRKLSKTKPGRHFAYELKGLNSVCASNLAENILRRKQCKEEPYSALWYRQSILMLLQHNPLAIQIVIPITASRESREVYWHLKSGSLDLDWDAFPVKQLFLLRRPLVEDIPGILKALIPFTTSVPEDYLANIFAIYRAGPSTRQALVEAGCTSVEGLRASIGRLRLHPLFSQFTRNQPWSEEDITSSWRRAAAHYHDRSIDWIKTGLYSPTTPKSKPKDEWENLTAVLSYVIPELDKDTEVSALFDLSWIVCSFHVFHKDIPKHAADMFADLTLKALNAMAPEFVPTSNEGLRFVVDQGLYARARKLSDFQILRITLLMQFLVHYYYDISPKTASIYQDALMILQDALPTSLDDQEFCRLFSMSTSTSFLTDCELSCEEGRMPKTMDLWDNVSSGLDRPSDFRTFADVWGETHAYRRLGFVLDLSETWRNHQNSARYSVDSSDDLSPLHLLDTLLDAFDALNSAFINQEQDLPPLDQSLRDAIQRDWETALFVLDKIDQCSNDICRRVQCLKSLGRKSEYKAQILELKNIVSRREDLWTSQDRQNEHYQNLYLINKPWMKKVDELLNSFGGTRVEEYYDFEIPPGRIGGLFLY